MLHWAPRSSTPGSRAAARGPGLRLELVRDMEAARTAWQALEANAAGTPFQVWSWIARWTKSESSPRRQDPVIVFGYDGDTLKLVLPLAIERRFGLRSLVWLGQDIADYNCPLIDPDLLRSLSPEDAGEILKAAATLAGGADCLKLEKQPEQLGGMRNPFALFSAKGFSCDAHATRLTGDWDTFHAGKRSRKSARRLREKAASLAKQHGELAFSELLDAPERQATLAQLLVWKSAQLEAKGSRNPFRDGTLGRFLAEAVTAPDLVPLVRMHVLTVGDELAAGALGFAHAGHYIYFIAAYDAERYARYSPGAILLTRLIEEMHREGMRVFDFSNGDERYKDEWCDQSMGLTVTLLPLTLKGRAGIALEAGSLRLIREIKSRPQVFAALRSFVSRFRSLRGERPAYR